MEMNKRTREKSVKFKKEILLIRTEENNLTVNKETKSLGMPWEKEYGYAQAVKVRYFL
jgi:hypothetical protein